MLTIVVPILNESKTGYLPRIIELYKHIDDCEILCVDGGSSDGTCELVEGSTARLIRTKIVSRAGRINQGIKQARYDLILLHHPRSIIEVSAIQALIRHATIVSWGAFTHKFDCSHPLLGFTSWYSNVIRGDKRSIYYLDHCIFVQKQLLYEIGLLPEIDIFEDTELCQKLNKIVKGVRLPYISKTSAIRFQSCGIYRQALKNQYLKCLFYFNRSDRKMNEFYERDLALNSQYNKSKSTKQKVR